MGDYWTESAFPLSRGRVVPFAVNVVELPHKQKASKLRILFLGRRWLNGGKCVLHNGVHFDRSNGLRELLSVSDTSKSGNFTVVSRRTGSVKLSETFVPTVSVVNLCQDNSCQTTFLEEEFNVAVRDLIGLVVHTTPVRGFFDSYTKSSLEYHLRLPAWVFPFIEKGRVLDMDGSQKSTRGKLHSKATPGVAGETERTRFRTNSPIEEEIEKYVCYTFPTDAPDGWIEPGSNGLYSKEALAYFSGGGAKRNDVLSLSESCVAMESSRRVIGGLSQGFSVRGPGVDENHPKSQQEFLNAEELRNGKGASDTLSGYGGWEQNGAAVQSESEGSYEVGSFPVFDESFYMGSTQLQTQLEAELQATSDAIEEMEGKVAIRLMVAESVLKGILRAVEMDAFETVEVNETQLLKVKQEQRDKDFIISALKRKEEELVKLVDESRRKERQLVMETLTGKEDSLAKVKESEKVVAHMEKEVLKMGQQMVELSVNLAAETKRVNVLERQIKVSREAEASKEMELAGMAEKIEQFRAEKESIRREARLRELRLAEILAEKDKELSQQLQVIGSLEAAKQHQKDELAARSQEALQMTENLAEKENILRQQLMNIRNLETAQQQVKEALHSRSEKETEFAKTLAETRNLVSEHLHTISRLESAEEELKEKLASHNRKEQELIDCINGNEEQLSKQLETIKTLELVAGELRGKLEDESQNKRHLMKEILGKDELISEQVKTISSLGAAEQDLRKEVHLQREKTNQLLQSGKDTSELLDKLRGRIKFHADTLEEKDRTLRFLQGEVELLNGKVQEMVEKSKSYGMELKDERNRIAKQEAVIHEYETRCQELSSSGRHTQGELAALTAKLLEAEVAAQLAQVDMQEQSWKHEREVDLIMTILEGRYLDIEREIHLFAEDTETSHVETATLKFGILQRKSLELSNLRSSEAALKRKLEDAEAAVKVIEDRMENEKEKLANKDFILKKAEGTIAELKWKLVDSDNICQSYEKDLARVKSNEASLSKQLKVSESELRLVRQELERVNVLEQDRRTNDARCQKLSEELEEKAWMLDFEILLLSSYMEKSLQDVLNVAGDFSQRLTETREMLALCQYELDSARDELSRSKEGVEILGLERSTFAECLEKKQTELNCIWKDLSEARAGLEEATAESRRYKVDVSALESQLDALRRELDIKLSRKDEEIVELQLRVEESMFQSQVESFVVMGSAEGSIQKLMENLGHARQELKDKNEYLTFLRCEVEGLSQKLRTFASDNSELKTALSSKAQELCKFKADFILQNAMQRDALVQEQSQVKEALKKIEELKRLKLTLLERIQEEKFRWQQLEEALVEQKWKSQVELEMVTTVMWEAGVNTAASNRDRDRVARELVTLHEELAFDDSKKLDLPKRFSPGVHRTESTSLFMKGKLGKPKTEPSKGVAPLPKLDLLVRENDELRREKEQLLTEKTDEIYRLKREFYKELEKVKGERKKDYESDGSQKEVSRSRVPPKPRQQMVVGLEPNTSEEVAKLEKVVANHERKVQEMRSLWDTEKAAMLASLREREEQIKELAMKLTLRREATTTEDSTSFEKVVADYQKNSSETRSLWDFEKATILVSLREREEQCEELERALDSRVKTSDDCARFEKVVADLEAKITNSRAHRNAEKSSSGEQISELSAKLAQALERERDCLARQESLLENLAVLEKERVESNSLHEREIESSATVSRNKLELQAFQLSEAVKDSQDKRRKITVLDNEVTQLQKEVSTLRMEILSASKEMEVEFAGELQAFIVSEQQLERGVAQRMKQYNFRLERANSLVNHLLHQFSSLARTETDHVQNLQNLRKAETEVDLLGDEVDALMDVLEKVYTVLSHYHPVIQHYPGLADLAKAVKHEVLQRLRDSDDVSL